MLVIDEGSFMSAAVLKDMHKKLQLLTQCDASYGGIHIIFVGDFHQLAPIGVEVLYKANSIYFQEINRIVF